MIEENAIKESEQRCAILLKINPTFHSAAVSDVWLSLHCFLPTFSMTWVWLRRQRAYNCVCCAPLWMIDASSCSSLLSHRHTHINKHTCRPTCLRPTNITAKSDSLSSFLTWTRLLLLHKNSIHAHITFVLVRICVYVFSHFNSVSSRWFASSLIEYSSWCD